MSEQETDQLAKAIYESRYENYFVPRWEVLRVVDKIPWINAADAAWRVMNSAGWIAAAPMAKAA